MLPKPMAGLIVILAVCTLGLTLTPPDASPAYAGQEDAALFQEALSAYGQWLNHGQHGLVWRPRQVSRNWQPYANGRWVPTQDGYVFETDEPWGWATYHYGNWLTTNDHGWVWVPGRTWYPHTVNWRTSDENVGWAPVPPPENLGSDSFYSDEYPMDYDSSGINSYRGYSNSISPLNWIFIRSTNFLMGWGQPYSSAYSYYGSGVLLSPQYIPVVYARTVYVSNYVSPGYAANAYYNWGPPVTYITRVTNINNLDIDRRCRETRLANLRNVMPPDNVTRRHPAWREILPARHGQSRPAPNFRLASGKLNYPNAVPAPASLVANTKGTRPSSPPAGKLPMTESGKTIVIDNKSLAHSPSRPMQLQQSTNQSQNPDNSRNGTTASVYGPKRQPELFQKNPPAQPTTAPGQQLPVSSPPQSYQSRRDFPGTEPRASQENRLRRDQQQHSPPDQQRAEQELRLRQQQRLLTERRQQETTARQMQEQQQSRSQQQVQLEQQRRQAEMQRHQQLQQQKQAEIMRQQQIQQQQQAEMRQQQMQQQQRQAAEMMRQQQSAQQQQRGRNGSGPADAAAATGPADAAVATCATGPAGATSEEAG